MIADVRFAELFMGCGLILNEDVCWVPVYGMQMTLCEKVTSKVDLI
mgnify:CR=1 FL=1